jgi:hypothetical protein
MNLVGLGAAGCSVVKSFSAYPQYNRYYVDSEIMSDKNFIYVKPQKTHEDYEAEYESTDLTHIEGKTTIVLAGSGKITGMLLRFLEDLKHCETTVLYIKPDMTTSDEDSKKREKVVFGVLQQYVRSGLLNNIFIASNSLIENVLESVSITDYWRDINSVISSTYHMLNVFSNTEPLLSTLSDDKETIRISTMGVVAFKNLDEKMFYSLKQPRSKKYYFGISQSTLNEEKDLLSRIRTYVKENSEEKCTACFAIYSTNYEQDYVYVSQHATLIQEQDIDF